MWPAILQGRRHISCIIITVIELLTHFNEQSPRYYTMQAHTMIKILKRLHPLKDRWEKKRKYLNSLNSKKNNVHFIKRHISNILIIFLKRANSAGKYSKKKFWHFSIKLNPILRKEEISLKIIKVSFVTLNKWWIRETILSKYIHLQPHIHE